MADPAVADRDVAATRAELIAWLRSTTPETVVAETIERMRGGVDIDDLWAAGALTAAHHVSNQARNLLGFVSHAMIGCEDARQAAVGQPEHIQQLLLIQALAQVVVDLHDPCFSPYELLDVAGITEDTPQESIAQLRSDVRFGEWLRADHRLVGLERTVAREDLVDLLLDIGLEGMVTDDHTLITPALSLDMMELTGWDAGFPMLRGTLRYSCTFPRDFGPYDRATALVERYELQAGIAATGFQADLAATLRRELLDAEPAERPRIVAEALATRGASADTAMAALSLAACDMYLQVDPVPHDDFDAVSREVAPIHIGTSMNILRASLDRMSPRTAVQAVLVGAGLLERGPSVLSEEFAFVPFVASRAYPYAEDVEALRSDPAEQLLKQLDESLLAHDARTSTAIVAAYAHGGGAPEPMIAALTAMACTDDGTLMHNVKHLHAMVEEFRACTDDDRWNFLIAAAKWVSWYAGKDTATYERASRLLGAAQPA
ncbi:MAG: hypothetical protein JJT89_12770 [Nitriliruptoraceae bacterium]|nr:hypothetical protein [Nitriliruptoraceae bacterium]